MARYKRLRAKRINRMMEYGYSRQEALIFTHLPKKSGGFTSIILSRPYTKRMLKDRLRLVKAGMPILRITTSEEAWAEWRFWYRESIKAGDYIPPRQRKVHKKLMSDGTIDREWVNRKARELRERKKLQKVSNQSYK